MDVVICAPPPILLILHLTSSYVRIYIDKDFIIGTGFSGAEVKSVLCYSSFGFALIYFNQYSGQKLFK